MSERIYGEFRRPRQMLADQDLFDLRPDARFKKLLPNFDDLFLDAVRRCKISEVDLDHRLDASGKRHGSVRLLRDVGFWERGKRDQHLRIRLLQERGDLLLGNVGLRHAEERGRTGTGEDQSDE